MVEILSVLIGFVVGVVAAGIAVELGLKKLFAPPETTKLTSIWTLGELKSPLIVAAELGAEVAVPRGARLVVGNKLAAPLAGVDVRHNPALRGNYVIDSENPRALLFLGSIHKDALALWTVDERLIARLKAEFNRLWTRSLDYVERIRISEAPKRLHGTVQMSGQVADVLPFNQKYLMRLTDHGDSIGVVIDHPVDVAGKRVSVTGIIKPSPSGFPLVEAMEVKAIA